MLPYIEAERARGTPLNAITRHMLGAFQGRPGARAWRRTPIRGGAPPGAGPELVARALTLVAPARRRPEGRAAPAAGAKSLCVRPAAG